MMQPSTRPGDQVSDPFARQPGSSSNPEIVTPPVPDPVPRSSDPEQRSPFNGAECPWGADQYHQAKQIEQAGYKIEFNCDLVLYNEDVYGSVTQGWPTFDEVRKNYYDTLNALVKNIDFVKDTAEKRHFSRITFNSKTETVGTRTSPVNGTELSYTDKTLFFTAYGTGDPNKALDYLKTVFEFADTHLDGLPVVTSLGKIRITGSPAQLEYTLSTLSTFAETYAAYRDDFLAARDTFREIDVGERLEDDAPLFRNGILNLPMKTEKPWALHDALILAKSYLKLPAEFRNQVMIDFSIPETRDASQSHPEQSAAKAIEALARVIPTIRTAAPGLQQLTLNTCGDWLGGIPDNCGSVNRNRTSLVLGIFVKQVLGGASIFSANELNDELARLFRLR